MKMRLCTARRLGLVCGIGHHQAALAVLYSLTSMRESGRVVYPQAVVGSGVTVNTRVVQKRSTRKCVGAEDKSYIAKVEDIVIAQ